MPVFLVGLIDGIIVPLTIYSFFSRVLQQQSTAIQITFVSGLAFAALFAIGGYFTRKAEIENSGESTLLNIYANLGISETIRKQMAEDTLQEQEQWQKEWNHAGNVALGLLPKPYATILWLGYMAGLILVLLNAYFSVGEGLRFLIVPVLILAIAGFTKYKIANLNPAKGLLTVVVSGVIAAIANWLIAGLF